MENKELKEQALDDAEEQAEPRELADDEVEIVAGGALRPGGGTGPMM